MGVVLRYSNHAEGELFSVALLPRGAEIVRLSAVS